MPLLMDEIQSLVQELTAILLAKKHSVSTAESCSGGLVATFLTELPGSSQWFDRGFITYSNLAKQEMLGVDPVLLADYGAVSEQVAEAMASGALRHSEASLSVAITGIAGPDGGSLEKPVGTVWIAVAVRGKGFEVRRFCFENESRQKIRLLACRQALLGLIAHAT